jgi:TetR/AcrR family transcriptional repressor of nem operon
MEAIQTNILDHDCKQVCLVAKLSAEVSSWSQPMREALARGYSDMVELYRETLLEGQAQGTIRAEIDPEATAALMHDLWTGAYLRASIQKTITPLRVAIQFLRSHL